MWLSYCSLYELVVVTAYLVWATIRLWKAGEDQLIHAQDTARRQLRAYVSVEPRGVSAVTTLLTAWWPASAFMNLSQKLPTAVDPI